MSGTEDTNPLTVPLLIPSLLFSSIDVPGKDTNHVRSVSAILSASATSLLIACDNPSEESLFTPDTMNIVII